MGPPMSFGMAYVAPALPEFLATHPDVSVDLHLSDEVIDLVGQRARARRIELRVDRAADFPRACLGDALRLRQVLRGLLRDVPICGTR